MSDAHHLTSLIVIRYEIWSPHPCWCAESKPPSASTLPAPTSSQSRSESSLLCPVAIGGPTCSRAEGTSVRIQPHPAAPRTHSSCPGCKATTRGLGSPWGKSSARALSIDARFEVRIVRFGALVGQMRAAVLDELVRLGNGLDIRSSEGFRHGGSVPHYRVKRLPITL